MLKLVTSFLEHPSVVDHASNHSAKTSFTFREDLAAALQPFERNPETGVRDPSSAKTFENAILKRRKDVADALRGRITQGRRAAAIAIKQNRRLHPQVSAHRAIAKNKCDLNRYVAHLPKASELASIATADGSKPTVYSAIPDSARVKAFRPVYRKDMVLVNKISNPGLWKDAKIVRESSCKPPCLPLRWEDGYRGNRRSCPAWISADDRTLIIQTDPPNFYGLGFEQKTKALQKDLQTHFLTVDGADGGPHSGEKKPPEELMNAFIENNIVNANPTTFVSQLRDEYHKAYCIQDNRPLKELRKDRFVGKLVEDRLVFSKYLLRKLDDFGFTTKASSDPDSPNVEPRCPEDGMPYALSTNDPVSLDYNAKWGTAQSALASQLPFKVPRVDMNQDRRCSASPGIYPMVQGYQNAPEAFVVAPQNRKNPAAAVRPWATKSLLGRAMRRDNVCVFRNEGDNVGGCQENNPQTREFILNLAASGLGRTKFHRDAAAGGKGSGSGGGAGEEDIVAVFGSKKQRWAICHYSTDKKLACVNTPISKKPVQLVTESLLLEEMPSLQPGNLNVPATSSCDIGEVRLVPDEFIGGSTETEAKESSIVGDRQICLPPEKVYVMVDTEKNIAVDSDVLITQGEDSGKKGVLVGITNSKGILTAEDKDDDDSGGASGGGLDDREDDNAQDDAKHAIIFDDEGKFCGVRGCGKVRFENGATKNFYLDKIKVAPEEDEGGTSSDGKVEENCFHVKGQPAKTFEPADEEEDE